MKYANFGQRLGSLLIDSILMLPLGMLAFRLEGLSRNWALAAYLPFGCVFAGYAIFCHGRFGQTIGKRAFGIRVVQLNGQPITWHHAWLRSSVDVLWQLMLMVGIYSVLIRLTGAEFDRLGGNRGMHEILQLAPRWTNWMRQAGGIWTLSEVITMWFNPERRALHDYLGGTLVISGPKPAVVPTQVG